MLWVTGFLGFGRKRSWNTSVVGFVRRGLDLRRSDKLSHGLLEFVDLGHSSEPWRLRDAVESRSS